MRMDLSSRGSSIVKSIDGGPQVADLTFLRLDGIIASRPLPRVQVFVAPTPSPPGLLRSAFAGRGLQVLIYLSRREVEPADFGERRRDQ